MILLVRQRDIHLLGSYSASSSKYIYAGGLHTLEYVKLLLVAVSLSL